jgi:hypothetical protein
MIEPITDEIKARRKAEWDARAAAWAADPRRITPPFTDAAIALLTAAEDDRRGVGIHVGKEIGPCDDYDGVIARDVRALAAEVQQARQRRCGNCRHHVSRVGRNGVCNLLQIPLYRSPADWFCADFQAKP